MATMPTLSFSSSVRHCAVALALMAGHNDDSLSKAVAADALPALVSALKSTLHTAEEFDDVLIAVHDLLWYNQAFLAAPLYAAGMLEAIRGFLKGPSAIIFPNCVQIARSFDQTLFISDPI